MGTETAVDTSTDQSVFLRWLTPGDIVINTDATDKGNTEGTNAETVTDVAPDTNRGELFNWLLPTVTVSVPEAETNIDVAAPSSSVSIPHDLSVAVAAKSPSVGGGDAFSWMLPNNLFSLSAIYPKLPIAIVNVISESMKVVEVAREVESGTEAISAVEHIYSLKVLHTDPVEVTSAINYGISRGFFTASLKAAGFPTAVASTPVTTVDVTEVDDSQHCTTVRVTQVSQAVPYRIVS